MYKSFTNIINSGCSFMAYPWEWQNKHRDSYDSTADPGVDKQNFAYFHSWVNCLSEKTKLPFINLAFPGNSNQNAINSIVRTVKKNNLTNSFIVLGLTQPIRHTIPSKYGVDIPLVIKVTNKQQRSSEAKNKVTNDDIENYNKYWYKVNYDEVHQLDNIRIQLSMLNEFVKSKDSKLLVIDNILNLELYRKQEIKNYEYFFSFDNYSGISWPHYIKSYDDTYNIECHPNTYDHKKFSELLYKNFFNKSKQKLI